MRPKLLAAVLCLTVVGCAGQKVVSVPSEHRVQAESSLKAAESAGAERIPGAAQHLEYARQQLADAERLLVEGEQEAADLRFRQAQADADLALALAHSVPMQREAQRATEQAEAARRSLQ